MENISCINSLFSSTALYLTAPGKAELATALFSLLTAPAALTTIPGLQEKKKFTCTISFRCQMPHFQMIYESPHLFSTSKISGTEVPHTPKENLSLAHRHFDAPPESPPDSVGSKRLLGKLQE